MKTYPKMSAEIVKLLRLRDCDATAQYAAVRIEELERELDAMRACAQAASETCDKTRRWANQMAAERDKFFDDRYQLRVACEWYRERAESLAKSIGADLDAIVAELMIDAGRRAALALTPSGVETTRLAHEQCIEADHPTKGATTNVGVQQSGMSITAG